MADVVRYEVRDRVAVVTLDRPHKLNAINGEMASGLDASVRRSETDTNVRAVVMRSSSDRAFSAGADLAAALAGEGEQLYTEQGGFAGFTQAQRTKPWIAAVDGLALGGGCEICLACDLIVATSNASFGLPEVQRGVLATAGGLTRLVRRLPRNLALEMILTGEPISAQRAYDLGFVNRLAQPADLVTTAIEIARRIAAASPMAVRESLLVARDACSLDEATAQSLVDQALARVRRGADYTEGLRAFTEKRSPVWGDL